MRTLTVIRIWLLIEVVGLVVAGVTAFPLAWELGLASDVLHAGWSPAPQLLPGLVEWIDRVRDGLLASYGPYPFLAYGTDWLAYAHLMIAIAFLGAMRDPVRNVWVVQWGVIMCAAVVPLALIAGAVRGIPWGWQLIDISFAVFGVVPLLFALRGIRRLERERAAVPDAVVPDAAAAPAGAPA